MNAHGIVFDFNGVLCWDSLLQEKAWIEYSKKLRGHPLTPEEMRIQTHGRNNQFILSYLCGHPIDGDELKALSEAKEDLYRSLCLDAGKNYCLSPGAAKLLDRLASLNIPRTIASASIFKNISFFFEHLKLHNWFDINLVVYDDGLMQSKPAPDMYLAGAQKIGLRPQDCAVVEDAISGIQAAHAAKIGCIAALGPREKHENLKKTPGVTFTIETLDEMLEKVTFTPLV